MLVVWGWVGCCGHDVLPLSLDDLGAGDVLHVLRRTTQQAITQILTVLQTLYQCSTIKLFGALDDNKEA